MKKIFLLAAVIFLRAGAAFADGEAVVQPLSGLQAPLYVQVGTAHFFNPGQRLQMTFLHPREHPGISRVEHGRVLERGLPGPQVLQIYMGHTNILAYTEKDATHILPVWRDLNQWHRDSVALVGNLESPDSWMAHMAPPLEASELETAGRSGKYDAVGARVSSLWRSNHERGAYVRVGGQGPSAVTILRAMVAENARPDKNLTIEGLRERIIAAGGGTAALDEFVLGSREPGYSVQITSVNGRYILARVKRDRTWSTLVIGSDGKPR